MFVETVVALAVLSAGELTDNTRMLIAYDCHNQFHTRVPVLGRVVSNLEASSINLGITLEGAKKRARCLCPSVQGDELEERFDPLTATINFLQRKAPKHNACLDGADTYTADIYKFLGALDFLPQINIPDGCDVKETGRCGFRTTITRELSILFAAQRCPSGSSAFSVHLEGDARDLLDFCNLDSDCGSGQCSVPDDTPPTSPGDSNFASFYGMVKSFLGFQKACRSPRELFKAFTKKFTGTEYAGFCVLSSDLQQEMQDNVRYVEVEDKCSPTPEPATPNPGVEENDADYLMVLKTTTSWDGALSETENAHFNLNAGRYGKVYPLPPEKPNLVGLTCQNELLFMEDSIHLGKLTQLVDAAAKVLKEEWGCNGYDTRKFAASMEAYSPGFLLEMTTSFPGPSEWPESICSLARHVYTKSESCPDIMRGLLAPLFKALATPESFQYSYWAEQKKAAFSLQTGLGVAKYWSQECPGATDGLPGSTLLLDSPFFDVFVLEMKGSCQTANDCPDGFQCLPRYSSDPTASLLWKSMTPSGCLNSTLTDALLEDVQGGREKSDHRCSDITQFSKEMVFASNLPHQKKKEALDQLEQGQALKQCRQPQQPQSTSANLERAAIPSQLPVGPGGQSDVSGFAQQILPLLQGLTAAMRSNTEPNPLADIENNPNIGYSRVGSE